MSFFDDTGISIALLAIIIGLRLALYVVERLLTDRQAMAPAPMLSPDDPAESPVEDLETTEVVEPAVPVETRPLRMYAELLDSALIAVLIVVFLIRPFLLQAFYIPSESMVPTLQEGDRLLAAKFTYLVREPKHGEIIVFRAPKIAQETLGQTYDPKHPMDYVKRVIGLPHDRIRIVAGDGVYVNGKRLREPYISELPNYSFPVEADGSIAIKYPQTRELLRGDIRGRDLVVPPGYLFVLGDNRPWSHDSHAWGFVSRRAVVGKTALIIWPPNRWGPVH